LQHASANSWCYETFLTKNFICNVTRLAPGGGFPGLLRTQPGGRLTESTARTYFQQLIIALEYAHIRVRSSITVIFLSSFLALCPPLPPTKLQCFSSTILNIFIILQGVFIGNLRLENLLLDSFPSLDPAHQLPFLKLCPFGLSARSSEASLPKTKLIAARDTSACDPFAEDIKAAGIILYQLLTGIHPYTQSSNQCFPAPNPIGLSEEVQNLISRMVLSNPDHRPSIQDIYTHSWFQQDLPPCVKQVNELWSSVAAVLVDESNLHETPALLNESLKRAETPGDPNGDPFISVEFPCGMWLRREIAFQEQKKEEIKNHHAPAGLMNTLAAEPISTASSSYFNGVSGFVQDTGYDGMGFSDDNMQ